MALRVCAEAGCPELVESGRCAAHRRDRERRRGSRQSRGYDRKHELLRSWWAPKVAGGRVNCWCCGSRISPLEPWDLGHCEDDRAVTHGPQLVACNRDNSTPGCRHPSHRAGISSGAYGSGG